MLLADKGVIAAVYGYYHGIEKLIGIICGDIVCKVGKLFSVVEVYAVNVNGGSELRFIAHI